MLYKCTATYNPSCIATVAQGIYSRSPVFDGYSNILTVEDVVKEVKPRPSMWLNVQVIIGLYVINCIQLPTIAMYLG